MYCFYGKMYFCSTWYEKICLLSFSWEKNILTEEGYVKIFTSTMKIYLFCGHMSTKISLWSCKHKKSLCGLMSTKKLSVVLWTQKINTKLQQFFKLELVSPYWKNCCFISKMSNAGLLKMKTMYVCYRYMSNVIYKWGALKVLPYSHESTTWHCWLSCTIYKLKNLILFERHIVIA